MNLNFYSFFNLMVEQEIINWISEQVDNNNYLVIPEDIFDKLNAENVKFICDYFNNNHMMKLPEREIRFFEWLKIHDPKVWEDIWFEATEEPYIVGVGLLPQLIDKLTGFPICELQFEDNYYFTVNHIVDKEAQLFLESIKTRFLDKKELTLQQLLLLQISMQPTDIWHFTYHFNQDLNQSKLAIKSLEHDKMLVHLTNAEHLSAFIDL